MRVGRNLVVCLVVVLLYSSLTSVNDKLVDNERKQPLNYSDTDQDLAMKIQLPGSEWQDNSVVEWSPADFEENRSMQFSVRLSNNINFDTITDISISLVSLEDASSPSVEYTGSIEIDEFIETENEKIAYSLHTYPSGIPQGDYSAMTTISFDDSTSMATDLSITMKNYSYGLSYDHNVLGFCYEQSTIFELKYRNTGGMLTELQFQIALDTIFEEDWQEQTEVFDGNYEMMESGEESVFRIDVFVSQELDSSLLPEFFNISITSRYIDDNGSTQTLLDEVLSLETYFGPCMAKITPLVSEIIDDERALAIDTTSSSNRFDNAVFPFSNNTYKLRVELPNVAVQDANVIINFISDLPQNDFTLMINEGGQNTAVGRNSYQTVVESLEQLQLDFSVVISNFPDEQIIEIEIEVVEQETMTATISLIELVNPYFQPPLSSDNSVTILQNDAASVNFNIERTKLAAYNRFDDSWIIDTSIKDIDGSLADDFTVTELRNLDDNMDFQNVTFSTEFNLTLELKIFCPSDLPPAEYKLTISMINSPTARQSSVKYDVETLVTVLKNNSLPEIEEPQNNETDNSSSVDNSEQNNSQNQTTNIDVDKDGVIDAQDLCPNTMEGEAVDEFGCKIIQDNNEDSENLTEELPNEDNQLQGSESASSKASDNSTIVYVISGLIAMCIVGVLVARGRKNRMLGEISQTKAVPVATEPIMPFHDKPLPALEPVVLQQWTDGSGYSWRQMSDQTIMWWNGTDWIPYGKN